MGFIGSGAITNGGGHCAAFWLAQRDVQNVEHSLMQEKKRPPEKDERFMETVRNMLASPPKPHVPASKVRANKGKKEKPK
ncbi:hypothetical protein FRZ44_14150 [Hypericibacter terrae]|uniref:Uncharacterized protein n=1 Tax=Hypericibacter terrae TaxID=2602015 RepID=A0A5J6MFB0_9PROT|nr:hypothetical protein FRZ44_14150 [Hypericibacter terrae]